MGTKIYIYCSAHGKVVKRDSNGRLEGGAWICEKCVEAGKKPKSEEGIQ